jgi:Lantibiotic dehydratase, N terminus
MTQTVGFAQVNAISGGKRSLAAMTEPITIDSNRRIRIGGHKWAFWPWVCLRGAGFPVHLVSELGAPLSAALADEVISLEAESVARLRHLAAAIQCELKRTPDERKKQLQLSLKRLRKGQLAAQTDIATEGEWQIASDTVSRRDRARAEFDRTYRCEADEIRARIVHIARDDQFRRAVLLQNRAAMNRVLSCFGTVSKTDKARTSTCRQNEVLVASYLQRYCVKNDSIGFFGPVGWAELVREDCGIVVRTGSTLVAKSGTYFEHWCIESLAESIASDDRVKQWIAPRLVPTLRVEGSKLCFTGGSAIPLPAVVAAILSRCDGQRSARQIAAELLRVSMHTESQVYELLNQLVAKGIVMWRFDLRYELYPERRLQSLLEKIEDQEVRVPAIAKLDRLQAARDLVGRATENANRLDWALGNLEATFVELTGQQPSRLAGKMYAGRTLVYQDCLRDNEVKIGSGILSALAEPIFLLTTSSRWLTQELARLYRHAFQTTYSEYTCRTGKSTMDLLHLWHASGVMLDPKRRLIDDIIPQFQSIWSDILQVQYGESILRYDSKTLRVPVETAFRARRAGWQLARYHSPDISICAGSVEDIVAGDCSFVLGELHTAANTMLASSFMAHHPCVSLMQELVNCDLKGPQVWPLPPRDEMTPRTSIPLHSPADYYLEIHDTPPHAPRLATLPVADLVVENSPTGLIVRTRDGLQKFDLIEFSGVLLSGDVIDSLRILPPQRHIPRIMIDRVAICRESWSFPACDLRFVQSKSEQERYVGARGWMRENRLPNQVFVRANVERKPVFLDFDSPVYIELFSRIVRRILASSKPEDLVTISEMLPTPQQTWLWDAQGRRYTSEFRITILDLEGD